MRTCADISEDLSAYLDGELPAQERAGVEAHLNGCAACKAEYESLMGAHAAMASLKKMKAPVSLREKVNAGIAAEPPRLNELVGRRRSARFSWTMLATGLAATVLVAMLGFHLFYRPTSNVADSRKATDGTTLAAHSTKEAQTADKPTKSSSSSTPAAADVEGGNELVRMGKRLEENSAKNREAGAKLSDATREIKDEDLKKPGGVAKDIERALDKDERLQTENKTAAAPQAPARRGEDRAARGAGKGGVGDADGLRDAPLAKSATGNVTPLDDKKVLDQRRLLVPREESTTEQQQAQKDLANAPTAPKPTSKSPEMIREKVAPDVAAKTEGMAGARVEPLAPTRLPEKPFEAAKADALKAGEKEKDGAAFGQAFKAKKDDAAPKDEPVTTLEARKDAKAEAPTAAAKPDAKQGLVESKAANDPAKGAEFDFAERTEKTPAPPAVGQGFGGGNGAARSPRGRADAAITLHTRDAEATLAKLKSLADARQASLAPTAAQSVDASTDKAKTGRLATLAQTEYILTVSAEQAELLRQDLNVLAQNLDVRRFAQKPADAATAGPVAPAKKADDASVTIRVIIESDLKK